jgi:hypothetical protein
MDMNLLFTLGTILVTITAFIVTISVLVNVTRADFKDFKSIVETRFAEVDHRFAEVDHRFTEVAGRLTRLEVDVAEIKAICRERSGRDTPV